MGLTLLVFFNHLLLISLFMFMLITMIPFQNLRVKGHSNHMEPLHAKKAQALYRLSADSERDSALCHVRCFKKVPVNIIVLGQELLLIKILLFSVGNKSRITYLLSIFRLL